MILSFTAKIHAIVESACLSVCFICLFVFCRVCRFCHILRGQIAHACTFNMQTQFPFVFFFIYCYFSWATFVTKWWNLLINMHRNPIKWAKGVRWYLHDAFRSVCDNRSIEIKCLVGRFQLKCQWNFHLTYFQNVSHTILLFYYW